MAFGKRIETIAKWVPENTSVADIGTDHAYLPVLLAQMGKITFAAAGDIASGPCLAAQKTIKSFGLEKIVSVRQGDGLEIITAGETDIIVIAGMGGATMIEILQKSSEIAKSAARLILQPMNAARELRFWCIRNGWKLINEDLAEEGGIIYEIIIMERGLEREYPTAVLEAGPRLLEEGHELLPAHLQRLLERYSKMLASMSGSEQAKTSARYREFLRQKNDLEAIAREINR